MENGNNKELLNVKISNAVKAIFAGGFSSGAITIKEELYCWGANFSGNISVFNSNPTIDSVFTPAKFNLNHVFNEEITSIAISSYHSLILTKSGKVFSCGAGRGGKLGVGNTRDHYNNPVLISSLNVCLCFYIKGNKRNSM